MRNIEVVELLLDKGAKVSAVDKVKLSAVIIRSLKLNSHVAIIIRSCLT